MSALSASLRLPAERSAPPRELEIRPKQVKAWLDALPLAQTVETARKMTAHLTAVNRAKVDADDRILILETYRPVASTVPPPSATTRPSSSREALFTIRP